MRGRGKEGEERRRVGGGRSEGNRRGRRRGGMRKEGDTCQENGMLGPQDTKVQTHPWFAVSCCVAVDVEGVMACPHVHAKAS